MSINYKISILTPSFNSGKYLERAIQSVLSQDYSNWEHIVMDGGSTDNTVEILNKYPHIIWRSEKDNGQSDAMNKAFDLSTGDIIVYLNADDYFEENIFFNVIDHFQKESCNFLVGKGRIVSDKDVLSEWTPETNYRKILLHFKYCFPLNPVSYFYKRHVQQEVGGFNISNHYTMDYEFLLKVYKKFKVHFIPLILGNFYFNGNNKTATVNAILLCRKTAVKFCKQNDIMALFYYKYHQYLFGVKKRVGLRIK